jgi:hypothetical protein
MPVLLQSVTVQKSSVGSMWVWQWLSDRIAIPICCCSTCCVAFARKANNRVAPCSHSSCAAVLLGPLRAITYVLMHGMLAAALGSMWVWQWLSDRIAIPKCCCSTCCIAFACKADNLATPYCQSSCAAVLLGPLGAITYVLMHGMLAAVLQGSMWV